MAIPKSMAICKLGAAMIQPPLHPLRVATDPSLQRNQKEDLTRIGFEGFYFKGSRDELEVIQEQAQ